MPENREVAEIPFLLPAPQLAALERAARRFGLTTAQMLRRLVNEFLHEPVGP